MGILGDYMKQVNQIGIVVRNLDETARAMESFFGIKLYIISMPEAEAELRGRTVRFAAKIGLARLGNVDLEFMEVVSRRKAIRPEE